MMCARFKLALVALLCTLCACNKVKWDPATQVVVTAHSDFGAELASVDATIYDVRGEKRGDSYTFALDGEHALPLSFSVVPSLRETTQFLVVLTGKSSDETTLAETRAIVSFVPKSTVGVHLWLYAGCRGQSCAQDEACTLLGTSTSQVGCAAIPVLESRPLKPGQELEAGTAVDETIEEGVDASTASIRSDASISDAGASRAPDADAANLPDALSIGDGGDTNGSDANLVAPTGPCGASPGQSACDGVKLLHCNALGESASQEVCDSARRCQLGLAKNSCATCDPGTFRCTGAKLERCAADGFTWELFKTCSSEALCNVQAGDCTSAACSASTRLCMGDDLYGCNQDFTLLTPLQSCISGLCDQANGECDVCVASARGCSGDSVTSCDSSGQSISSTPCPGTTPKCIGNGQCVQCTLPSHCTAPTNPCLSATCSGSPPRCGTTNKAARQPCSGGVCNGSGSCVQCVLDGDCTSAGKSKCLNNTCVQCKTSGDCSAGFMCNPGTNTCQQVSISGTWTGCTSYGVAVGTQCGGYYCGVTETQLGAAMTMTGACGNFTASQLCTSTLRNDAGKCARDIKSMDPLSSNAVLRPKIEACIRKVKDYSYVSSTCMGCYLDSELCAGDKCLIECLTGDSRDCDSCRQKNNCEQALYPCGGLPNPF